MSTRSYIGICNSDFSVDAIYCHYDGYINGVGQTLFDYYKTEDVIRKLIALGDIRGLCEKIDEIETFRSRGEDWESVKPEKFSDGTDIIRSATIAGIDYIYNFNPYGPIGPQWMVWCLNKRDGGWKYLNDEINELQKNV